jgi:hypothetical protein
MPQLKDIEVSKPETRITNDRFVGIYF